MAPFIPLLFAVILLGTPLLLPLAAQSAPPEQDRLVGKWVLDPSKSTFGTIRRTFADGRSQQIEYVAEYDREYPVTGTEEYDHVLLKRIDDYTAEAVLSHANKVYGTSRRRIAPDGQTMTITFRRDIGGSGVPVTNVSVYEKEEE